MKYPETRKSWIMSICIFKVPFNILLEAPYLRNDLIIYDIYVLSLQKLMMSAIIHVNVYHGGCGSWPCGGRADPAWPSLNGLGTGARLLLATVCRPGPGPAIQFNCHLPPELPIKFQRYSKFRPCHAPGAACLAGSTILEFKMELDRPMSSNLSITLWTCTLLHKPTAYTT